MIAARTFVAELRSRGVELVTGVPCSWFAGPLALLSEQPGAYVPAANEGAALALAAGAELAGRRTAVLLQNSGFGNLISPLTSLVDTFAIPVLVFMTLRGWPDPDADEAQHATIGRGTLPILRELGVAHRVLDPDPASLAETLDAADEARAQGRPFFVLIPRGVLEQRRTPPIATDAGAFGRAEAVRALLPWLTDSAVFATTGRISRELFAQSDRLRTFYMLGSMGHAAALGLGAALARPDLPVVVLDGDGAALMHLGTMTTIGAAATRRYVHVLLDNGVYESTGGQSVWGPRDWAALALAAGYRSVYQAASADEVAAAMSAVATTAGPHLVLVRISPSGRRPAGHPLHDHSPERLAARFREHLHEGSTGTVDERGNAMSERTAGPATDEIRQELIQAIADFLAEEGQTVTVGADSRPTDLDLDSIGLMMVLATFERKYEVSFDNDILRGDPDRTVGQLAAEIAERIGRSV